MFRPGPVKFQPHSRQLRSLAPSPVPTTLQTASPRSISSNHFCQALPAAPSAVCCKRLCPCMRASDCVWPTTPPPCRARPRLRPRPLLQAPGGLPLLLQSRPRPRLRPRPRRRPSRKTLSWILRSHSATQRVPRVGRGAMRSCHPSQNKIQLPLLLVSSLGQRSHQPQEERDRTCKSKEAFCRTLSPAHARQWRAWCKLRR
jgi:hypothetical protein